jgi:ubiquinone/menaquinone biosynthesis C-methylase UbiE
MIPFNQLGPVFKIFASFIYPRTFRAAFLSVLQKVPKFGAVLDIGSGTGILSRFAHDVRKDLLFTMIDPAPGMLRFGPGFGRKIIGLAESLPFRRGFFEALFIGDAFHHFSRPQEAIREITRVLKPKGLLVIFEIDPGSSLGASITWGERIFREPAHFYRPRRLAGILAENGFECRISQYGWRYAIIAEYTGVGAP